jgi:FMN phosphatase YigB (HAD superfamily)
MLMNAPVPAALASAASFQSSELEALLARASAVSFDFFDTLFIRPLAHPEDAFDILGSRFGMPDFRARRRAAQSEAFRRMVAAGRKEITLADIYACWPLGAVPSSELMKAEYELELALVEPNPELLELFAAILASGKPVVITSDMYLSADFFLAALRPHGWDHLPLFISADRNATKRDSGELFDAVAAHLGLAAGSILHIGDNELADVTRPRDKGLMAFHYRAARPAAESARKPAPLALSLGQGLLRTRAREIAAGSYAELGFAYGGPANLGFLDWVGERARADSIEHVLFLSRDGFTMERIARADPERKLPPFCYFLGSRTAYTLAAMTADNFTAFLPFLLSGADGLAPHELLERIGVTPPAPPVMDDLGLGHEVRVTPALYPKLSSFLYAYRWEILKICQRNRSALYRYLRQMGLKDGSRVALVDVGWSGTSQEAFEMAVRPLMQLEVFGYYFCLADTPERQRRAQTQRMTAMVDAASTSAATVASVYANRVAAELFFSAPHSSVIGLRDGKDGVEAVLDEGRGDTSALAGIAQEVSDGVLAYAQHYLPLRRRLDVRATPLQTAWPLIELLTESGSPAHQLLGQVKSFDAWGSSRNHQLSLSDY